MQRSPRNSIWSKGTDDLPLLEALPFDGTYEARLYVSDADVIRNGAKQYYSWREHAMQPGKLASPSAPGEWVVSLRPRLRPEV